MDRSERSSRVVSRLAILVECWTTFSRQNFTDLEGEYRHVLTIQCKKLTEIVSIVHFPSLLYLIIPDKVGVILFLLIYWFVCLCAKYSKLVDGLP